MIWHLLYGKNVLRVSCLLTHLLDFHEIWYGGNAIQGDLDVIIFIPIVSIILQWSRFKFQMKLK
jgi:prolipoprotein diacylglyceryltransferase